MEYVVVLCDDEADLPVWIDDRRSGRTGQALKVERGTHTLALCPCATAEHTAGCEASDYRPVSQDREVENTNFIRPLEVTFERI